MEYTILVVVIGFTYILAVDDYGFEPFIICIKIVCVFRIHNNDQVLNLITIDTLMSTGVSA